MKFKGTGVALITPFTKKMEVDYIALDNIVRNIKNNGVDYLVMLGTTSESPTLSEEEKKEVVKAIINANENKLPLVVGIGGNNTLKIIKELKTYDFTGISAILSVVPYYNKPNQNGLYEHYKLIAENSPLPIILYNIPGRTGVNMTAETTLKLANDFSNIAAIKEASANFDQIMEIIANKPADFTVISGDDNLTLPLLSVGAEGVISVIANAFPTEYSEMVNSFLNNPIKSQQIHYQLLEFIKYLFIEGNPAGVKALMSLMGYCEKTVRPPLVELSDANTAKIMALLNQ